MAKRLSSGEKVRRMRKLLKRGHAGYGTELSEEMNQYVMDTMSRMHSCEMDADERKLFMNNTLNELKDDFVDVCCNQFGSQCVEAILTLTSDENVQMICKLVRPQFRNMATDVYGSRVFEKLLKTAYPLGTKDAFFAEFMEKSASFLFNNFEEFLSHRNANFIIRTILTLTKDNWKTVKYLLDPVNEFCKQLINWPVIRDFPFKELTAGFLNVLIQTLRVVNFSFYKQLIKFLQTNCFNDISRVLSFDSAIHVLETIMETCKHKCLASIYKDQLRGHLVKFLEEKKTCFLVEKLIKNCTEVDLFGEIIVELTANETNCFKLCLKRSHGPVIIAVCQKSAELKTNQAFINKQIMVAFECYEPEESQKQLLMCLLSMTRLSEMTRKENDGSDLTINMIGALLVQSLLKFDKPRILVQNILAIPISDLMAICTNPYGCHIIDTFMQCEHVGAKNRGLLITKLKKHFPDLLQNKYGSRSFDAIWDSTLTGSQRYDIMLTLRKGDNIWRNSFYGNIMAKKLRDWLSVKNEAAVVNLMKTMKKK